MRFGISTIDGILLKSFRTRRPHAILPAIHPPRPGRWGLRSTHPGGSLGRYPGAPDATCWVSRGPRLSGPRSRAERSGGYFTSTAAPDLLELLLHVRRLGLGDLLLHGLGRAVHEILGLLEAEPGQLAHDLDHLDLLVARRGEDDVELRLLLRRRGRAAARRRRRRPPPPPPPTRPTSPATPSRAGMPRAGSANPASRRSLRY